MPFRTLAVTAALIAGGAGPVGPSAAVETTSPVIELGLSSPLESLEDIDTFRRELAERLVWTVKSGDRATAAADVEIRFTAVRLDRGRVTASYQSDRHAMPEGLSKIASSVGPKAFMAFPDVCLSPDDPPASVRALSGRSQLGPDELEEAIAHAAQTRDLRETFGLDESLDIEWGRQIVLVLAAVSENPEFRVRPLIMILERK